MKAIIRLFIRKIIGAKEHETISDAVNRKKYSLLKKFNKKRFSTDDFRKKLIDLGLKKGDIIIVHSSWRSFIGYDGSPQDIINCIKSIIGENGTILMPAFTIDKSIMRYNDTTSAGYIAETFRKNKNVFRSLNNVFSICAFGKYAKELTEKHIESKYAFDNKSPYYLAIKKNAKILLLGLGKKPHKITLFHCITYELRKEMIIYSNVYTEKKNGIIYDKNNNKISVEYFDRKIKYQNNKKHFKKLFLKNIPNDCYNKINKLDMYLFDSKDMFEKSKKYIVENNYNLYKN